MLRQNMSNIDQHCATVRRVDTVKMKYPPTKYPLTAARIRKERRSVGLLYKLLRHRLGLTQSQMGVLLGCSRDAIVCREHSKRTYTVDEMVTLCDISGLSDAEFFAMLREIAK